jgi:hypothetical protein
VNAASLIVDFAARGIVIGADRGRLWLRPKKAVTATVLTLAHQHKGELLALLDPEVGWRVKSMRGQVLPFPASIPLLLARPDALQQPGCCLSCGDVLGKDSSDSLCCVSVRCRLCVEAARIVLEEIEHHEDLSTCNASTDAG